MKEILGSLSLVYVLLSSVVFRNLAQSQCLSANDDLSLAPDTNLAGIQDFSIDIFKRLLPKDDSTNFVFSPYSIWNALVLAYFGSSGETERQFQTVLRVTDKVSTLKSWRELEYSYLMRPQTPVSNTFVVANRVFFDQLVRIRECMFGILPNELQQLDFKGDPAGAANTINALVSETTRGHIKKLISTGDVNQARLVLVNAAFFKGAWSSVFKPERTENRPFNTFSGQAIDVPTMTQFGAFKYGFDDALKFDMLELPYVGDHIAMYILRPYMAGQSSFDGVVSALTPATFNNVLKTLRVGKMHIFLPKFSLETSIDSGLTTAIQAMGLTDAFNELNANFNGFSLDPNLYIQKGLHKAFLEVNEEGTEAGASTAFIIDKIGGNLRFICDRPFLFIIRDNSTGNLLFMGAFKNPPQTSTPTGQQQQRPEQTQQNQGNFFTGEQQQTGNLPAQNQQNNFPTQNQQNNFPEQNQQNNFPQQQQQQGNLPAQNQQNNFPAQNQQNFPSQNQQNNFPAQNQQSNFQSSFPEQKQEPQHFIDFGSVPGNVNNNPAMNPTAFIRPQTSDVIQPQTSDVIQPQTSDVIQPQTSDVIQTQTSDFVQPQTFDFVQPQTFDFVQPHTSGAIQPQTSNFQQPQTNTFPQPQTNNNFQQPQTNNFQQPQTNNFQQPQTNNFQQPQTSNNFQQPQTNNFQQPQTNNFQQQPTEAIRPSRGGGMRHFFKRRRFGSTNRNDESNERSK